MNLLKAQRRPVSLLTLIAFVFMFYSTSMPAHPKKNGGNKSKIVIAETTDEPGAIEVGDDQEESFAKPKKFPWAIVIGLAVIGGAALYFLVLKKPKHSLVVSVGGGISGCPFSGKYSYKKDENVQYSYSLMPGYKNLEVTIDGVAASQSGTIKMDKDHTLNAVATLTPAYTLTVSKGSNLDGTPESGTYSYQEGSEVAYYYSPQALYVGVDTTLDGAAVPAYGTIVMDSNHSLVATAVADMVKLKVNFAYPLATGMPTPGEHYYPRWTTVQWDYVVDVENMYVMVYIDGSLVCTNSPFVHCSGSIVMNEDHEIVVNGD